MKYNIRNINIMHTVHFYFINLQRKYLIDRYVRYVKFCNDFIYIYLRKMGGREKIYNVRAQCFYMPILERKCSFIVEN